MKAVIIDSDNQIIGIVPDSAIEPSRNPFFVPDTDNATWSAHLYVGVRIDRLGKGISPKFADRYFNEVISAVHPAKTGKDPIECSRDGALLVGEAISKVQYPQLSSEMSHYVALASEQMTLKTGDLVLRFAEYGDTLEDTLRPGLNGKVDSTDYPPVSYKIR